MCARSKGNLNSLIPALGSGNKSVSLGFVDVGLGRNGRMKELINQQFRILIGDAQNTNFWNDNWTGKGQWH